MPLIGSDMLGMNYMVKHCCPRPYQEDQAVLIVICNSLSAQEMKECLAEGNVCSGRQGPAAVCRKYMAVYMDMLCLQVFGGQASGEVVLNFHVVQRPATRMT